MISLVLLFVMLVRLTLAIVSTAVGEELVGMSDITIIGNSSSRLLLLILMMSHWARLFFVFLLFGYYCHDRSCFVILVIILNYWGAFSIFQETLAFLSVFDHVLDLGAAAIHLPLTLTVEERLCLIKAVSAQYIRLQVPITNNFRFRNILSIS